MAFTVAATRASAPIAALLSVILISPVAAQQPTQAQRDAIRSSCRSDFMANCSGVQPGGKDALDCLKRNLGKLSGGCQAAVSAVSPAPAPAAVAAPPPPTPPAAAAPVTSAPAAPVASAPAAPASKPPAARPAPVPKMAVRPPPAAAPPPVAAAPAVQPLVLRPMLPRRRLMLMAICRGDAERLCAGLPPIGPAVLDCLAVKAANLSPTCYEALARVSRP